MSDSIVACQILINSGMAWNLEGHVGRICMDAIKTGACMLGAEPRQGAFGNIVPARTDAVAGGIGSREYVVETFGEGHAQMLELLPNESDLEVLTSILF